MRVEAATIQAASASFSDVQTAVTSSASGDTVTIPNGSADWGSSLLNTGGKQIIIRALNYTATSRPTNNVTRNVVITWNGSGAGDQMINFVTGNTHYCGIGGIEIRPNTLGEQGGAGIWGYINFSGSGTKPGVVFDCHIVGNERQNVSANEAAFITCSGLGCVVKNTFFDGTQTTVTAGHGGGGLSGAGIQIKNSQSWTTASTMGTADTDGNINVYFEDCFFDWFGQLDGDERSRVVCRQSTLRGISWQNHGFTSGTPGRHFEQYDTLCLNDRTDRNFRRWFWLRGGTCLFTDNALNDDNSGYGSVTGISYGDNSVPSGSYPVDMGPGRGHNGTSHVSDPVYMWGNTGGAAIAWGLGGDSGWTSHFVEDRDIFVSANDDDAKPSYTKYTYPHPVWAAIEGGGGSPPGISARVGTGKSTGRAR